MLVRLVQSVAHVALCMRLVVRLWCPLILPPMYKQWPFGTTFEPIRCESDCTGTFRLRYKGQYATIQHAYGEEEVASKLMALSAIKVCIPKGIKLSPTML